MPRRDNTAAKADRVTGYPIPENLTPDEFVEFCIRLPKEKRYLSAFWQQMDKLTYWHAWQHPISAGARDYRAKEAADFWDEFVYLPNRDKFELGEGCGCNEEEIKSSGDCYSFKPVAQYVTYKPTSPYDGKNAVAPGYYVNPWRVATGDELLGLQKGDVYTSYLTLMDGITPFNFPIKMAERLLNGGFPRFEFEFTGKGEVELHLINMPQGGLFLIRDKEGQHEPIITVGSSVDAGDLDQWIDALITILGLGVSGGLFPDNIVELHFDKTAKHTIEVTLLPRLNIPNFLESGWGGGIREIVVCGKRVKPKSPPPPKVRPGRGELEYQDPNTGVWFPIPDTAYILDDCGCCEEKECIEESEDCDCV